MRTPTALFLTGFGLFAQAQNCFHVVHPSPTNDLNWIWSGAAIHPSGGVVFSGTSTALVQGFAFGRTTPQAEPLWERGIMHMNPAHWLWPGTVQLRSGAGYLINGRFSPASDYDAPCIISLGAAGQSEWARTYMTDSTEYGSVGSFFVRLAERPDGDHIVAMHDRNTIGLARLTTEGVPVWHYRYPTEAPNTYAVDIELEPDNAITLLGYGGNNSVVLVRTDPEGEPQWGFHYPMVPIRYAADLLRASDGSFYVACGNGNGGIDDGDLIHFNSDGTCDWMKHYNKRLGHLERMPNGDLLASCQIAIGDSIGELLRLDPSGTPLAAWATSSTARQIELLGLRGDSVFVFQTSNFLGYAEPTQWASVTIAVSVDDLSCAYEPTTLPTVNTLATPTSNGNIVSYFPDQLKSWTINIGESLGANELDITAHAGSGPARPGFGYMLYTNAMNQGGSVSGPLTRTLTFDPLLTYVSADPEPTSVVGNTITWEDGPAVGSYSNELAYVEFTVPADAGLIGTTMTHTFTVAQDSTEFSLVNNTTTITSEIMGSYDPNDKQVLPRNFYHIENDSILDYTIQFQNTGNDTAFTVVVRDTLPLDVDTRTFEMGAASHPYTYSLTGNGILTFTFANILLPDSNTNEPLSHGLVNFRIKPILPLALGQEITNSADIYFDFNDPIHTPDATVVVTDETGVRPLVKPAQLVVYPVPVKNNLTALLPEGFKPVQAFAVGADGRRLPMSLPPNATGQVQFATQHLPPGAYVLTLRAQDGKRMSARFTKE
jgi:hypothetical protein